MFSPALANIAQAYYANTKAELTLLATALGTDPTTYPSTIQTAPGILNPSLSTNTYFIDRVDLIINKGKAGGLLPAQMATALTNVAGAHCHDRYQRTTHPTAGAPGTTGIGQSAQSQGPAGSGASKASALRVIPRRPRGRGRSRTLIALLFDEV